MEELLIKYKDENGFISDIMGLYKELCDLYGKKESLKIINNLYEENKKALKQVRNKNNELEKALELRKKNIENVDYIKKDKLDEKKDTKKLMVKEDVSFYITYIKENLDNDSYLDILPKNNDKESMIILINILSTLLKIIEFNKYFLTIETNKEQINIMLNEIEIYTNVYNKILEYKNNLKYSSKEELEQFKNKVSYFMYGDIPYIYKDIKNNPESFDTVLKLIDSIKNGTFKNIEFFINRLKGLIEVKHLSQQIRIIFEIDENGTYCIIGALLSKSETNSIHQERLVNRYKIYKDNKNNKKTYESDKSLRKLLKGDNNE